MIDKKKKLYKNVNGILQELNEDEVQKHDKLIEQCYEIYFEKIKNDKIERLLENTKKRFYDIYPLHRQCNIAIFGTDEEKAEFRKFHSSEARKYDEILEKINNCSNEDELLLLAEKYSL